MSPRIVESAAAQLTEPAAMTGVVLGGRYTITRRLALGGVGVVYLASDARRGQEAVVKLLGPHAQDDPDAVARFEREARRLGAIHHPNVVRMLDHGHYEGRAYLVMEYIRGEVLETRLRDRGALSLPMVVSITSQLLEAVGHAHERGTMIRDIKPSNIMLCERDGRADHLMLLDFGLAKLVDEATADITRSQIVGTMGYIAPEVLRGAPADLRADVYAIGVMLYRMLSGRFPFTGDNDAAVFFQTVHVAAPDLAQALPLFHDIPDGLVALVHECLSKEPDARPAQAAEVMERLIDSVPAALLLRAPAPTPALEPKATPPSPARPGPSRRSRSRALPLVIGSAAVLLGGGLAWGVAFHTPTEAKLPAQTPAQTQPRAPAPSVSSPRAQAPAPEPSSVSVGVEPTPDGPRARADEATEAPPPPESPESPAAAPQAQTKTSGRAARHHRPRSAQSRGRKASPNAPPSGSEARADTTDERPDPAPPRARRSLFLSVPEHRARDNALLSPQDR